MTPSLVRLVASDMPPGLGGHISLGLRIYSAMAKHLVDIDEEALGAARAELGTKTIRDTVNEALVRAAGKRSVQVRKSLDRLASLRFHDREDAWR